MRKLENVIDQILAVSTNKELNKRLEQIKFDIGFTAPELMGIRWHLTHEALCDYIPNPIENDETIKIFCIFTTMTKEELLKAFK
jgi:hypothetical protein